jgi:hypothetical protein
MINSFKYFDAYSLKARVFPALIAGLPVLALLFVLVPWNHIGLPHLTAMAMGFVLLFAFADVGRRAGKHVQSQLGTGATPEQWYRGNPDVSEGAKDRYRAFIAKQLKIAPPTAGEEQTDPARANDFYLSACAWLREHTRDTRVFSILFAENITYGFRRNLLGLRTPALFCNAAVAVISAVILYFRPTYFAALPQIDEKMVIILAAVLLHSAYMLFAISHAAVREASRVYGRQLILSCETLMKKERSSVRKKNVND